MNIPKEGMPPSPDLMKDALTGGFDNVGRRGMWITTSKQAVKLRIDEPGKDKEKADAKFRAGLNPELPVRRATKRSWFVISGSIAFFVLLVILGHECFGALAYQTHINNGLQAMSDGKADAAQVEFSLAISADPKSSDAYYYRALAEDKRGSVGNAYKDFKQAIELDHNNLKANLARAVLSVKTHRYDLAVNDCTTVLRANPSFIDAYRVRAAAYNHLNKYPDAIADSSLYLGKHQEMDPYRGDALAKRAFAFDQKEDYTQAVSDYSEAIQCDPLNGSLFASRAIALMQCKQWKQALADCSKALRFKPNDPVLFKVRGVCYSRLDMGGNSLKALNELVMLSPSVDTHLMRGNERLMRGDLLGTLKDYDYVLGAQPDDRATQKKYQRAKLTLQGRAPRNSVVADQVFHARIPNATDLAKSESALIATGRQLMLSGDREPAIAYLSAAVKTNGANPTSRRYLAHSLIAADMNDDAIVQFGVLAQLQPLVDADKLMFAKALVACKQMKPAVGLYMNLLANNPRNDVARTDLIETLLASGSADDAVRVAREGMKAQPQLKNKYSDFIEQAIALKSGKALTM